jgi:type VI secretion system (T6SS) effector Hcp
MTTHSTIRTVLRALVAGLFAAGLTAAWPLSAEAGKSGGGGKVQTHDMSVTKKVDRASPILHEATTKGTHVHNIHIDPPAPTGK